MYHWFKKGVKMSGNAERNGLEEQEFVNGNLLNLYHQKDRFSCGGNGLP